MARDNMGMSGRWLRHITKGTIYACTPAMVSNPKVEEVSLEVAFPEKHIPEKQKGRKAKLDLSTDEEVVEKAKKPKRKTKAELAADASKGLPK